MSWTDKELKKRTRAARHSKMPAQTPVVAETERMAALWRRIENANDRLPPELKLVADLDLPANPTFDEPQFRVWLKAPNGAGLGFTGDAVRYLWPERNERSSNNFWIRWTPDDGFRLARRIVSRFFGPKIVDRSFSEQRAEYMVKCLVLGHRIKPRAVRRKRLWLF